MATNVTQKDKTLQEVIDWCENERRDIATYINQAYWLDAGGREFNSGKEQALDDVIKHCAAMLGYGGSMPLEVPNQSEDAK